MKKQNKIALYALILYTMCLVLQGCAASKDCGCGSDLNRAYKSPKRYH